MRPATGSIVTRRWRDRGERRSVYSGSGPAIGSDRDTSGPAEPRPPALPVANRGIAGSPGETGRAARSADGASWRGRRHRSGAEARIARHRDEAHRMIRTTPFHERTSALNQTGLWEHWSNHLAAVRYQQSEKFEY